MSGRSSGLAFAAALVLAGCAATVDVTTPPVSVPVDARTYRMAGFEPPTSRDVAVQAALRRHLQAQGWREVEQAPVWRVEAAYSVRPGRTGGYSDESARAQAWLAQPLSPPWWALGRSAHGLTVSLSGWTEEGRTHQIAAVTLAKDANPETTIEVLAQRIALELRTAP
ncbi:MAG TPA: hypothetical protein PLQ03_10625 [Brevundimonas sp.]|uniref:hypothetical protein n=1 Tax=Brevundimonas sp. TaxID=1871086 RepID=UPI00261A758E|nr:hypothetical protein [Brevundimonas sp.]HRO33854.1 hypothetical protein [Brevundimonas sp.]